MSKWEKWGNESVFGESCQICALNFLEGNVVDVYEISEQIWTKKM